MNNIVQAILAPGAQVFVPVLILILGLIFKMKFSKALQSALNLSIGFVGMSMVIGYLVDLITPVSKALAKNTGINLPAIDVGWTGAAAVSWGWSWAFAFFALTIGINFIMLLLKWTKTINADMWNVWGKVLTGYMVYIISGSLFYAFVVAGIQIIIELKLGDVWQPRIQNMIGAPSVTVTHIESFTAVIMYPVNRLMDFIPALNKKMDANALKKKIGILSEPAMMGLIIGIFLGLGSAYDIGKTLNLATSMAAVMALFPVVAKFFQNSLTPFGNAMSDFMKIKFKDREFYIGLDWPILGSSPELWVTAIIGVPVFIIWALVLPGNTVLPFGGVINYCIAVGGLLLTQGNLPRMIILDVIYTPLFLYGATLLAPILTKLGRITGAVKIPAGSEITWSSIEAPDFRILFAYAGQGNIWAIGGCVALMLLAIHVYRMVVKKDIKNGLIAASAEDTK